MLRTILALFFVFLAGRAEASDEKRIALVVGNANYQHLATLKNPSNDADLMRRTLMSFGYEVLFITDASADDFRRGFQTLVTRLNSVPKPTYIVMYFAGHGVQVGGTNFLLPVNASFSTAAEIKIHAHNVTQIVQTLAQRQSSEQVVLLILDACSNNPFSPDSEVGRSRGLAPINLQTIGRRALDKEGDRTRTENYNLGEQVGPNMIVAMASDPGTEASDGKGRNSPYVEAFVKAVENPTTPDIRAMFGQTRLEVRRSTNGQQSSWLFGSLGQGDVDMGFRREPLKQ